MMNCTCKICGRKYVYNRKSGHTTQKCNSCSVNMRRFERRKDIIRYLGGKCSSCGYSKCTAALQAHHVDPSKKSYNISGSHSRSWKAVIKELDKCVLLCKNCHAEEHEVCDERYK